MGSVRRWMVLTRSPRGGGGLGMSRHSESGDKSRISDFHEKLKIRTLLKI